MKHLTIIRHAKSSWGDHTLADFDRPLNERGQRNALTMGKLLSGEGFSPELIISSPALRAITTAEIMAAETGYTSREILQEQRIYEANTRVLFEIIQGIPEHVGNAVLIGHNPGLENLVSQLLFKEDIGDLATCATAQLRLLPDHWSGVSSDTAELIAFRYPRMFDNL